MKRFIANTIYLVLFTPIYTLIVLAFLYSFIYKATIKAIRKMNQEPYKLLSTIDSFFYNLLCKAQ